MALIYANNVAGTLAANIGPSDNVILLGPGQGSSWPAPAPGEYFYATLQHIATGIIEIVKVTARTSDSLSVARGQDATAAASFATGSVVEMRIVAQMQREVDFNVARGAANGLASLDASTRIPAAQMPTTVPLLVAGKLDISVIPDAVATDAELANYLPKTGGTITGSLTVNANLAVNGTGAFTGTLTVDTGGAGAAQLKIGNDAYFTDVNVPHTIACVSVSNPVVGYIRFGNNGLVGYDGGNLTYNGAVIWSGYTFDPASKLNYNSPYAAGDMRCTGAVISDFGRYRTGGTDVVLGAGGGGIYLRPHGTESGTNQGIISSTGLAQFVDVQSYSDRRMKTKIRKREVREYLGDLIEFKSWNRKADGTPGIGPIAQQVQEHAPEWVGVDPTGLLSVNYAGLAFEVGLGNSARLRRVEAALQKAGIKC